MDNILEEQQKVASQKLAKMVYGTFVHLYKGNTVQLYHSSDFVTMGDDDIATLVAVLKSLPVYVITIPNRDIAEIIDLEYNENLLQEFGLALRKVILEFPASDSYEIADHNLRTWFCNCESLENELRTV